jgi:hypothetical protein
MNTVGSDLNSVANRSGVTGIFGLSWKSLGSVINDLMPYVFATALTFVLVYIIMGGYAIMTSKADPKAMEAARTKITHAIIGFIIIFIAYWLVQLLGLATGLNNFGGTVR